MDRAFHGNAKKLADASKQFDYKESSNIYGEMVLSCVNCHAQFAFTQFPELNPKK